MKHNSIICAGAILLFLRLAGLIVRYLISPPGPILARLAIFLTAVLFHAGVLVLVIGIFLAVATLASRVRWLIASAACLTFLVLAIFGQIDLTLTSITGEPLTPTVFRTFRGVYLFTSSEFLDPLKAHLAVALAGTAAVLTAGCAMTVLVVADIRQRAPRFPSWSGQAGVACVAVALTFLGAKLPWAWATPPVEVAFAREYLGLDIVRPVRAEPDVVGSLHAMLGLPPGMAWLSADYPLVYGPAKGVPSAPASAAPPDIVVVFIESLRAGELGFMRNDPSATPNLNALATRSVVFPLYTSNGFPTAPSVIAFHTSGWPHRSKQVVTDFADRNFDALPRRLADLGYDTRYIGADPHLDKQNLILPRWYQHVIDLAGLGVSVTDRNTVRMAIEDIQQHDRVNPDRPFFAFVSTLNTHYDFNVPGDGEDLAVIPPGETIAARYRRALQYTDRQVGSLLNFLASRTRSDRTVIIVVGDHSFYVDLARTSGLPENENEWTSALINGPSDLVGPPRWIYEPASHVDMMPTILAMVGDRRPSATLGGDLFAPPRNGAARDAISVRPGGIRMDKGGYAYLVDSRTPSDLIVKPAFPDWLTPPAPSEKLDPVALSDWVSEYSNLIERDQIWSDQFLARP